MVMDEAAQLQDWLEGKPQHCPDRCCPDLSCCRLELLAPPQVREAFIAAYQAEQEDVLLRFYAEFRGLQS